MKIPVGLIGKTYGLQLAIPTAWISSITPYLCSGENGQVHQIEDWVVVAERTTPLGQRTRPIQKQRDPSDANRYRTKVERTERTIRPHIGCDGLPLTPFKRLFPLAEGRVSQSIFFPASLRQWSDHLSQSHRKYRTRIMNDVT